MQTLEKLKVNGELRVVLTGPDGAVKEDHNLKNLVVDAGLNFIVNRMKEGTATPMSHMSLGDSTTAAAASDTTLGAEITGSRVGITTTTVAANTITYVAAFAATVGTGAITESGIFNSSTAGTLLCRTVFPVVNKQEGDSMTVTWTVTVS